MNVQKMNKEPRASETSYKSLLLLDEIAKGEPLSQRDLSRKLNIALGLVNSYLKNLASKGLIKVGEIPPKRFAYYLTPKGFSEKTRLTYHYLQNYTNLYRNARRDFKKLFSEICRQGVGKVVFAGIDEVTEIAYLSLQEVDIQLQGAVDDEKEGESFFGIPIIAFRDVHNLEHESIIITTFGKKDYAYRMLIENGVHPGHICTIYDIGSDSGGAKTPTDT